MRRTIRIAASIAIAPCCGVCERPLDYAASAPSRCSSPPMVARHVERRRAVVISSGRARSARIEVTERDAPRATSSGQDHARRRDRAGEPELRQSVSRDIPAPTRSRTATPAPVRRLTLSPIGSDELGHRPQLRCVLRSVRRPGQFPGNRLQDGRLRQGGRDLRQRYEPALPEPESAICVRAAERNETVLCDGQAVRAGRQDVHVELRWQQFRFASVLHRRASGARRSTIRS